MEKSADEGLQKKRVMLSRLLRPWDKDDELDDEPEEVAAPTLPATLIKPDVIVEDEPELIQDIFVVPKPKEGLRVFTVALLDSEYTQLIQSLNNDFFEQNSPGKRRVLKVLAKIEKAGGSL